MRYIRKFFLLLFFIPAPVNAQTAFNWVKLGVNGLTCSQCTRSVEMKIRQLDFVDSVSMNLEHTEGEVFFKKGKKVDIERIADAVTDAGFSVRYLKAGFTPDPLAPPNNCFSYAGDTYCFLGPTPLFDHELQLQFIGPKYLPRNELKTWKKLLKNKPPKGKGKTYWVS
ncbi:MAG TPA: heavy-metal-associated domain-containing protein [Bacteroidia bacterium]